MLYRYITCCIVLYMLCCVVSNSAAYFYVAVYFASYVVSPYYIVYFHVSLFISMLYCIFPCYTMCFPMLHYLVRVQYNIPPYYIFLLLVDRYHFFSVPYVLYAIVTLLPTFQCYTLHNISTDVCSDAFYLCQIAGFPCTPPFILHGRVPICISLRRTGKTKLKN